MSINKLREIFVEVFDDPTFQLTPETPLKFIKNWDSLNLIGLALSIEKAFSIKLSAVEVTSIQKIADIIELLESKGIPMAVPA